VLEEDAVCEPVAVSELEGVPVLLGEDVCKKRKQARPHRKPHFELEKRLLFH